MCRVVFILVGICVLMSDALARAQDAAGATEAYPADLVRGGYEVAAADELRFQREGRELALVLKVRYPVATEELPGPFPLVVFSHGMGGYTDAFEHLSEHLASHGYVVVHPAHTDSVRLRREAGESAESLRRTFTREGTSVVDLRSRVEDCEWILANLDGIEAELGHAGLVDRELAAMAGHSAGAMTTQALAGLRFQMGRFGRERTLGDGSLFDAYIVISGQGTTRRSLTEASWAGFGKPTLVFAGSEDVSRVSDETPESRRHPYEFAPAGGKYLVFIEGATHSAYQGGAAPNADERRIEALTSHATLAFLECSLRGDETAGQWLADPRADKFGGVVAEYLSK
jgi:predicted dienelactone hydrolase